jgi:hypothetical protein
MAGGNVPVTFQKEPEQTVSKDDLSVEVPPFEVTQADFFSNVNGMTPKQFFCELIFQRGPVALGFDVASQKKAFLQKFLSA